MDRHLFPSAPMQNVYLLNGFVILPGAYGGTVKYENIAGLVAAIFERVVLKPSRLNGGEIAYLRGALDIFQAELAQLVGVDEQTVSLWERGKHTITAACDIVLRRHVLDTLAKRFSATVRKTTMAELALLAKAEIAYDFQCEVVDGNWSVKCEKRLSTYRALDTFVQEVSLPGHGDRVFAMVRMVSVPEQTNSVVQLEGGWERFTELVQRVYGDAEFANILPPVVKNADNRCVSHSGLTVKFPGEEHQFKSPEVGNIVFMRSSATLIGNDNGKKH